MKKIDALFWTMDKFSVQDGQNAFSFNSNILQKSCKFFVRNFYKL